VTLKRAFGQDRFKKKCRCKEMLRESTATRARLPASGRMKIVKGRKEASAFVRSAVAGLRARWVLQQRIRHTYGRKRGVALRQQLTGSSGSRMSERWWACSALHLVEVNRNAAVKRTTMQTQHPCKKSLMQVLGSCLHTILCGRALAL
jgi:hypothetical protein